MLKSFGVRRDLEARAKRIAEAAGEGHEIRIRKGRTRWRATVRTATSEARVAEATDQNLSRAFNAGRG